MKNNSLKSAGLIILAFFSTQVMASSPWADDTETEKVITEEPATAQSMPVQQHENEQPVMHEEIVEPVGIVQTDSQDTPEPASKVETETMQQGDVLNINDAPQVAAVRILDFPRRGMTTDKVENELGRPAEIIPSVGQPPISRWVYDDRTVYFEYSSVIHVVAK
ncbi:MAG: hypothetical protein OQK98_14700 [Gammaproteobacteria bacterium]|nr:hypothetical protein [Gammaproteobacteria bacterium]